MYVAHRRVCCSLSIAPGTTWVVDCFRMLGFNDLWKHVFVIVPSWKVRFQPGLGVFVRKVVMKLVSFLHLVVLVVPRPDDEGRMASELLNVLSRLVFERRPERLIRRIVSTGKAKVLPDQNSKLIASIVECLIFVYTASPHSDHVLVPVLQNADPVVVILLLQLREVVRARNPARAACKNILAIDSEIE